MKPSDYFTTLRFLFRIQRIRQSGGDGKGLGRYKSLARETKGVNLEKTMPRE